MSDTKEVDKEFDKASWFPLWVTEQIRKGQDDPWTQAVKFLPKSRRLNLQRKLETLLNEEQLDMKDQERATFRERLESPELETVLIFQCGKDNSKSFSFTSKHLAAQALLKWLQEKQIGTVLYNQVTQEKQKVVHSVDQIESPYTIEKCKRILERSEWSCHKDKYRVKLSISIQKAPGIDFDVEPKKQNPPTMIDEYKNAFEAYITSAGAARLGMITRNPNTHITGTIQDIRSQATLPATPWNDADQRQMLYHSSMGYFP
jgi:hypothetical protein